MGNLCRASVTGLEIVDRTRKKQGWNKDAAIWCERAFVSEPTLRRFWQRAKIRCENFNNICLALNLKPEEIFEPDLDPDLPMEMDIVVLDQDWVGRESVMTDLMQKLQASHRIVLLLGITGIGKTALAESLVVNLRGNWQELRENCENTDNPKDFATIATGWLNQWGETINPDTQGNSEQLLALVLRKLSTGKYLVLVDSLEYLLVKGDQDSWGDFADPWWGRLFIGLLSAPNCQSKMILTSQDFPVQLASDCARYAMLWQQILLSGLTEPEQKALWTKLGFSTDLESQSSPLMRIAKVYDGHPLTLRVIAGEIRSAWQNNVVAYWRENSQYIEEVETALELAKREQQVRGDEDRWQLASYTVQLRRFVKARVEITFSRLKQQIPVAYELLCIASIYRCEVPEWFWLESLDVEGYDSEQQQLAITTLRDRYLVEESGFDEDDQRLVSQHNLIRSVAIAHRLVLAQEKDFHA